MSWTASLLGFPSNDREIVFSDIFLLLEFTSGQRYLASVPKNPQSYLCSKSVVAFAPGQRFLLNIPKNSISYLPTLIFKDCDGDAIPEAWIQAPVNKSGTEIRSILFSLPFKEPNLIFDTDDQLPSVITMVSSSKVSATFQDGSVRTADITGNPSSSQSMASINPKGFRYLNTTKLNNDGSTNFVGSIGLSASPGALPKSILEITYKFVQGGWEYNQIKVLVEKK
jgi:hypothetical protein